MNSNPPWHYTVTLIGALSHVITTLGVAATALDAIPRSLTTKATESLYVSCVLDSATGRVT